MKNVLEKKILAKEAVIGVIGLGYIGLSLLEAFGVAGFSLVGYDYNSSKIQQLQSKTSYLNFMPLEKLFTLMDQERFETSSNPYVLEKVDVIIICVPTALDQHRVPNLANVRAAFSTTYLSLKKNQLIILQSTTYPGTTQEELLPLLEQSALEVGKDFFLANVPEVADIGNPKFSFTQVPRIVGGVTPACQNMAEMLYQQIGCKTVPCSSPRVAEAAKLLQNSYRLVNISLINEMKMLFDPMEIDVWEVIEAAASKPFGFVPFYPGPGIGGDCIPIVSYYLIWKGRITAGPTTPTTLMEQAGHINEMMPYYLLNKIIKSLKNKKKMLYDAKILMLGIAYKKDVNDVRESPGLKLLPLLMQMFAEVNYHDPFIPDLSLVPEASHFHCKSVTLEYESLHLFDVVVIITDHSYYDWEKIVAFSQLVVDTRNATASVQSPKPNVIKA